MPRLLAQRQQRQAMLDAGIGARSARSGARSAICSAMKERLAELVGRLSKLIASKSRRSAEARREAQRRELTQQELPPASKAPARAETSEPPAAPPEANTVDPPRASNCGSLAENERATAPADARGDQQSIWHRAAGGKHLEGPFHRRQSGQRGTQHRQRAGGFAEWMRGFGNLLIVDHGSSYLSIYANNDSLLKQVGDEVRAGETIATVGNSGGNPESGLYFELRHQGKPLDPLAWVSPK
jgi:septal ring factor EnvC (AmiA/AmiB activator)